MAGSGLIGLGSYSNAEKSSAIAESEEAMEEKAKPVTKSGFRTCTRHENCFDANVHSLENNRQRACHCPNVFCENPNCFDGTHCYYGAEW